MGLTGRMDIDKRAYVLEFPGSLSGRAFEFLRSRSRRVHVDPGLTGDELRDRILHVYGRRNDAVVDLLSRLQARYGGLSYESGFFGGEVMFTPVCEPEDPDEELEILYAVHTGSVAGASVKATGEVEVGLDGCGVPEFASLDDLIECDAMFAAADSFAAQLRRYVDADVLDSTLRQLRVDEVLRLRSVPRASGAHTFWFEGDSSMIVVCGCWSVVAGAMPPVLLAWADSDTELRRIDLVLESLGAM